MAAPPLCLPLPGVPPQPPLFPRGGENGASGRGGALALGLVDDQQVVLGQEHPEDRGQGEGVPAGTGVGPRTPPSPRAQTSRTAPGRSLDPRGRRGPPPPPGGPPPLRSWGPCRKRGWAGGVVAGCRGRKYTQFARIWLDRGDDEIVRRHCFIMINVLKMITNCFMMINVL